MAKEVKTDKTTGMLGRHEDKADSREKLEADIAKAITHTTCTLMWPPSANKKTVHLRATLGEVYEWLDRQAAITERECIDRWDGKAALEAADLRAEVGDLTKALTKAENRAKVERHNFEQASKAREMRQERLESLVRCLAADHGLDASWDGLRRVWIIERTPMCAECAEGLGAYADGLCDPLKERIAELEAELEAREHLERDSAYMRLPVDADGVPIRPGDKMTSDGDKVRRVIAVSEDSFIGDDSYYGYSPMAFRHVQPDTVESLLADFQQDTLDSQGEYVGEVIDADEWERELDRSVEKYAERIRRALDA